LSQKQVGSRERLSEALRQFGETAIARHLKRPATPGIKVTTNAGRWWFDSPYDAQDEDHWVALMFDAFGTRSQSTFCCFMTQLSELCSNEWNEETKSWHPAEDELVAAVQIVRSTKPRTEAEACLAAQMVAVHLMQMKLSAQALKHGWPEPRTCAIAAKLARTYAMLFETMAKLKGKGSRQRIIVKKFAQHEHKHIHLYPGDLENGDRPHEPTRARQTNPQTTIQPSVSPALSCSNSAEHRLSNASIEGPRKMPTPRRS